MVDLKKIISNKLGITGGNSGLSIHDLYEGKGTPYSDVLNTKRLFGEVEADDWYKVWPYQIVVMDTTNKKKYIYTLPIPPEHLAISSVPASSATATLGGVVEETSVNVFWQIQLAGTTGVAPRRANDGQDTTVPPRTFRDTISTTGLLAGAFAGVNSVISAGANVFNSAKAIGSGDIAGGLVGVLGGIVEPPLPYSQSAVSSESNGHHEIIGFQRFLYSYSALKDNDAKRWKLFFLNHKDDQAWQVVNQGIAIQRSANEPNLYRYKLNFKGWGITSVYSIFDKRFSYNRYKGDLKSVNTMTLTGIKSSLQKLKGTIQKKGGVAGAMGVVPKVI